MVTRWTDQQKDAISAKGAVMVTAAAGSGKTAVLVERVIEKLCDPIAPIPADRLLIVTFTRAAAAEMRQRIEKALSDRATAEPGNVALHKQQLLISSADICTIDSFCIKLVRNYFNTLELPPDFSIADANTALQIRRAVLEEIFREHFESQDAEFMTFLHSTDSVYGDGNAMQAVFDLYDFTSTMAQPKRWLEAVRAAYQKKPDQNSLWIKTLCQRLLEDIPCCLEQIDRITLLLEQDVVLGEKGMEVTQQLQLIFREILSCAEQGDYDGLCDWFQQAPAFPRLTGKKYDQQNLAEVRAVWQSAKDLLHLWAECCSGGFARIEEEVQLCRPSICQLVTLCTEFSDRYLDALREQALLTFSHTEQLALRLLTDEAEDGGLVPSAVAMTVADLYDEVMVDEFQDVNDLQSRLFDILSDGGKKLFTVGDAKQSIYGFRGANPEHFLQKGAKAAFFSPELLPEQLKRIVLSKNFRSRAGICDFVNGFFALTMSQKFGGMTYDSNEMLYPGAAYPDCECPTTEAHVLQPERGLSVAEAEAIYLADYIEKTRQAPPFLRQDEKTLRKADYGDFALLLRKAGNFPVYVKILRKRGIPVSLGYGRFFETTEIMTALSFLRVIDHPLDDISMLAVMLSPVFGFTEDDVVLLKKKYGKVRFYRALLKEAEVNEKAAFLRDKLHYWRVKAACMPTGDFLSLLLNDSGYNSMILSMSEPMRRQNNLILLEELAAGFAREHTGDLSAFLRQMDYLAEAGDTKSQTTKEQNSVRIMTMHMSKGLQFPITVVGDVFSLFNRKETVADLAFSQALGVAFNPVVDAENRKIPTLMKQITNKELLRKQWEEELRLLYVTMTRAEERLVFFLTAESMTRKFERATARLLGHLDDAGVLSPVAMRACGNIGDWLLMYLLLCPDAENLYDEVADYTLARPIAIENASVGFVQAEVVAIEEEAPIEQPPEEAVDPAWMQELEQVLSYRYPFAELRSIETKTSVSALTKRKAGREFCATARPAFLSASGLTPTERGTALHKFMQYADFPAAIRDVSAEIERLYEYEYISRAEADAIDLKRVGAFFETELFRRILAADRLFREQRFMLAVSAEELYPDLSESARGHDVIVQGAVDCMFVEGDHIVLIDFKTDRTDDADFLLAHYSEQLRTYCHAAEKMLSLPVRECYLYSLHMSRQIPVVLNEKNHA